MVMGWEMTDRDGEGDTERERETLHYGYKGVMLVLQKRFKQ